MTAVARASPDITTLRIGKVRFEGGASGQNCETAADSAGDGVVLGL